MSLFWSEDGEPEPRRAGGIGVPRGSGPSVVAWWSLSGYVQARRLWLGTNGRAQITDRHGAKVGGVRSLSDGDAAGGALVLLVLYGALLPFLPIIGIAGGVALLFAQLHPLAGVLSGLATGALLLTLLWRSRIVRAIYAFAYAYCLQLLTFCVVAPETDIIWAAFAAFVVGGVTFRISFYASGMFQRQGHSIAVNAIGQRRAWLAAAILSVLSTGGDFALARGAARMAQDVRECWFEGNDQACLSPAGAIGAD